MMKSDGILDEIKNRLDVVEIISEYVQLKKSGQNYKGICPFHSEKTPSFMVSPSKQIFHCFGCGAGGDIAGFVMKLENLTFPEALTMLAKRAGVKLKDTYKDSGEREKLRAMQNEALEFFSGHLKKSKTARSYLESRGVSAESITEFSLGYSPKEWHLLYERLKAKGYGEELILKSGLVSAGPKGPYDNFRDRIMFPITDARGEVIAFGGRVMDDTMPKYLNSPDTPLFRKGDNLYGLHQSADGIRKKDYSIVVEGYLDVIMSFRGGFKNVVAPLGTALTPGHLKKLSRYSNKLLLVFDGDKAGVMAAKRSLPVILEHGMRAKVLLLPEGNDPDSLIRAEGGAERMKRLISASSTPVEFLLKTSGMGKTETVREAVNVIASVKDPILKEELLAELSERSGIRETALREELKRRGKSARDERKGEAAQSTAGVYDEETLLISSLLAFPEKAREALKGVSQSEASGTLLAKALSLKSFSSDSLMDVSDDAERAVIRKLLLEPGFDPEAVDKTIADCVGRIKRRGPEARIMARIKDAESSGDLKLISALIKERNLLKTGGNG